MGALGRPSTPFSWRSPIFLHPDYWPPSLRPFLELSSTTYNSSYCMYNLHFRIAFLAVWFSGTARRTSLAVSAPSWESGRVGIRGRQSWSRTYSLCLEIPSGLYHKCSSIAQYLRCRVANFKLSVMNTFMTRQISDGEYWKSGSALLSVNSGARSWREIFGWDLCMGTVDG